MELLRREVEFSDMYVAYLSAPTIRFAAQRFGKKGEPERSCSQDQSGRCRGNETCRRVILFVKRFATSTARSSALTHTTRAQELPYRVSRRSVGLKSDRQTVWRKSIVEQF